MTGNTYGALKAKLTRHWNELNKFYEEERLAEISRNKDRWYETLEKLKKIDPKFDEWYDSPVIPDIIWWRGDEFEKILKIVEDRLSFITENKDE